MYLNNVRGGENKMKANGFMVRDDDESGQMGAVTAVMTLILVGAILFVGLAVMDGVADSTGLESGDTFYNASTDVTSGVESAFGMSGTLMIIIIAAAVIGAIVGMVVVLR